MGSLVFWQESIAKLIFFTFMASAILMMALYSKFGFEKILGLGHNDEVKSLAKKEGISINQFISSAVAEKMSSLLTEQYLLEKSQKGSQKSFLEAMSKVAGI